MTRSSPPLASILALSLLVLGPAMGAGAQPHASLEADAGAGVWTTLTDPVGPDPRINHSLVAAPELGLVIMMGGLTSHGVDSDVWMIRPRDAEPRWFTPTLATADVPGPRQSHSAVWDPDGRRMIVFGGYNPEFAGVPSATGPDRAHVLPRDGYNDVWALEFDASGNATRWRRLFGALTSLHAYGLTEPVERWNAVAVYDSKRKRLVVQGGVNRQVNSLDSVPKNPCAGICVPGTPLHATVQPYGLPDTWSFDLVGDDGWTLLDADGPKQMQHYAVYDPQGDRMITVVQYGLSISFSDGEPPPPPSPNVRSFDMATGTWTDWPDPPQPVAPGLTGAYGYVPARGELIALGQQWDPFPSTRLVAFSLHLDQPGSADTRWERLPGTPSEPAWSGEGADPDDPIAASSWGYDVRGAVLNDAGGGGIFVAFGGEWSSGYALGGPTDLPVYDLGERSWSVIASPSLTPRSRHAAVLDPSRRHMYSLGGRVGGLLPHRKDRLWRLDVDSGTWEVVDAGGPAPKESNDDELPAMAVHDPVGDRILQVAAYRTDEELVCMGDVHALDLNELRWSRLVTVGDTPRVCEGELVYDSERHRLVLVNGFAPITQERNRTVYELDLEASPPAWAPVETTGSETGVLDRTASAVYDPIGDRVLVVTNTSGNPANPAGTLIVEALTFDDAGKGTWSVLAQGGQKGVEGSLTVGPRPRSSAQVVFQLDKNRVVIWGGRLTASGNPPGDPLAYALDLFGTTPAWQDLGGSGEVPAGRVESSAVYDAQLNRMIVFAGLHRSQNNPHRGTHALDLS